MSIQKKNFNILWRMMDKKRYDFKISLKAFKYDINNILYIITEK